MRDICSSLLSASIVRMYQLYVHIAAGWTSGLCLHCNGAKPPVFAPFPLIMATLATFEQAVLAQAFSYTGPCAVTRHAKSTVYGQELFIEFPHARLTGRIPIELWCFVDDRP